MEADKSNNNYGNTETQRGSGEPGFVFTEYDRGARSSENKSESREEPAPESVNQSSQN